MSFKSKLQKARRNSKYRISLIIILIILAGILFYFVKNGTMKIVLGAIMALLATALGMEATGNDYDVQKLIETKSFKESKVEKKNGYWKIGDDCNVDNLNCSDFQYQEDAQDFYESCGGANANRLDGNDQDGKACESLPKRPA
ncbi:hypothetical protein CSB11_01175 [Candidatus Campbellbacteria bacterium]|nr:MAG: hypothetical protein CSB11_01175 [Candidatus Campbellbacteria bacterium]